MRIASTFIAGALAGGLALAAGRSENITYVDGNLTGVSPKSTVASTNTSVARARASLGSITLRAP